MKEKEFNDVLYTSDKPISIEKDDALNRKEFINAMADSLIYYKSEDCLVVGLYGEWGSGKTSILNLVKNRIQSETAKMDSDVRPVVFYFKPWNFSTVDQLLQNFFEDLAYTLRITNSNIWEGLAFDMKRYARKLSPLVNAGISVLSKFSTLEPTVAVGLEGTKQAVNYIAKQPSLAELRGKLVDKLSNIHGKIVIFIDDIDRLDADQMMLIFRLVKQIADFPNIIYVLSMDKSTVVKVIKASQSINAEKYLEKIVQATLIVPAFEHNFAYQYLYNEFIRICGEEWKENTHLYYLLRDGIIPLCTTLRDCKRLLDVFRFKYYLLYSSTGKQLNYADLLGLCTIETFCADLVFDIYKYKDALCGQAGDLRDREKQQLNELGKVIDDSENKKKLENIVGLLFPKFSAEKRLNIVASYTESTYSLQSNSRIADLNIFDVYFRLTQAACPVGREWAWRFVSAKNHDEMNKILVEYSNSSIHEDNFWEYIKSYATDFPNEIKENLIYSLYNIRSLMKMSDIYQLSVSCFFVCDAEQCGNELLWSFLDNSLRFNVLKNFLEKADIYTLSGRVCCDLLNLGEKNEAWHNLDVDIKDSTVGGITHEQVDNLLDLYVERISELVTTGNLFLLQCFGYVLILWNLSDSESYKKIIKSQLNDTYHKLRFICGTIIPQTVGRNAPQYPYNFVQYEDIISRDEVKLVLDEFEQNVSQYYPGQGTYTLTDYQLKELAFVKLQLFKQSYLTITPNAVDEVVKMWKATARC